MLSHGSKLRCQPDPLVIGRRAALAVRRDGGAGVKFKLRRREAGWKVTALVTIILVGTGALGTGWLWLAIAGLVLGDVTLTLEPPPGRRRR